MNIPVELLLLDETATIKEAMEVINKNGLSTVFLVNERRKIIGLLTDGDIRTLILKKISLDSPAKKYINRKFVYAHVDSTTEEINSLLNERIKIIPLVNSKFQVVDYATLSRIRNIPIYEPILEGNELSYVQECIRTGWISSQGKFIRQFENKFSEFLSAKYALATSSGTTALHIALLSLGIGKGDEVIVPDLTFAASVNAIIYTGATPVLVDIEYQTLNMDIDKIEPFINKRTKAIMVVHLYGNPVNMEKINYLAQKYNLKVIEDCAESFGSKYKNNYTGTFGDVSCFSFFGNKTITTGEGGMVVFKKKKHYLIGKKLRDHGMSREKRYWHDIIGYNYRMTNLQAAVGVAQLEKANYIIEKKIELAKLYYEYLSKIKYIHLLPIDENSINTFWMFPIFIKNNYKITKEIIKNRLKEVGIETRNIFYPIHTMPPYQTFVSSRNRFNNSVQAFNNGLLLPSSPKLTEQEVKYIANIINESLI